MKSITYYESWPLELWHRVMPAAEAINQYLMQNPVSAEVTWLIQQGHEPEILALEYHPGTEYVTVPYLFWVSEHTLTYLLVRWPRNWCDTDPDTE